MDTMTSVGKKFANFARGRNTKKKLAEPRDDSEVDAAYRKASFGGLSPNYCLMGGTPGSSTVKSSKSNSLGSINSDTGDAALDQDDIIALTHNVRSFSDALAKLKAVLMCTEGVTGEDVRVSAHEKLGEVLYILKAVLQKYPPLHNTEVLTSAAVLITKIKSCQYEDLVNDRVDLMYCVDQLALSFSSSVSEYLMGDIDSYPSIAKTKSYDNLATPLDEDLTGSTESQDAKESSALTGEEIDRMLLRYDSGVDVALQRAKAWAKYAKDIILYVEKRTHMENEFAKNLQKLATNVRQSITEDGFLPFQSVYCTVLDQDIDFSNTIQATTVLIQSQKFIEPLSSRRNEHEKKRKNIKDDWNKELRRMHEAVANVRKTKSLYITRQQEYEKAKETAQKAESESLSQSSAGQANKLEKKKKLVEDVLRKAMDAETSYKGCVAEANHRQQELERVKGGVLKELRELIHQSDHVLKSVTVSYFQLMHTVAAPAPLQFQALWESTQQYEAGSQFCEYIKRLPIPADDSGPIYEPFEFEPYNPDNKMHEPRKPSTQSSGSGCSDAMGPTEYSPLPHRIGVDKPAEDSDSESDESPSSSPYPSRKDAMVTSSSFGDLPVTTIGSAPDRLGVVSGEEARGMTFRGVILSRSAQSHKFRKLRSPSKCRECESYVYFQGAECEKCGLSSHKKCLETLHWECGNRPLQRRMTTFGVDFSAHVLETHTDIPYLVQKCAAEVDSRGINIKGIYRISGVKSRVEKLCQSFEIDEGNVDLREQHPNVIANVLKLYLRQLPEPLLTFALYKDLICLAKDEQQGVSYDVLARLTSLIRSLPVANFRTCGLIMHHLKRVTDHQEVNQMSASNLGIVFGPTLLRPSEGAASFDSLLDTPHQTRIIELLILNVESIFGPEHIYLPKECSQAVPVDEMSQEEISADQTASESDSKTLSPEQEVLPKTSSDSRCERKMRDTSSLRISRYVPPEFTENLLDELAKEEPRFLQSGEDLQTQPGVTVDVDLGSQSASDAVVSSISVQLASPDSTTTSNTEELSRISDMSVSDDCRPRARRHFASDDCLHAPLATQVVTSTPIHSKASSELAVKASGDAADGRMLYDQAEGSSTASSEQKQSDNSPGLRKKLLPAHVRGRPVSSASIFYTKDTPEEAKRSPIPVLTKPKPFTPPLQRQMNAKRRLERPPLLKPGSLDLPSTSGLSSGNSSSDSSPCNPHPSSTFYINKVESSRDTKTPETMAAESHKETSTDHPQSTDKNAGTESNSPQSSRSNLVPVSETRKPEYV